MPSKQKTLHSAAVIWSSTVICRAVWIFRIAGAIGSATPLFAQTMPPTLGEQVATLRLIAAPGPTAGGYQAGIDIAMAPGSHTYWQQPGEAGVPPVFAFNGSVNVAKAEVRFPAPSRISEDGIEAIGYTDHVVFPVFVTPVDRGKPAVLKVDVAYAVCNKICIPAHGAATIVLAPGAPGLDGAIVASALTRVPAAASDAEAHALSIVPAQGTAKPSWVVTWTGADPVDDMFAVAPEGFYFDTKKLGPDRFMLTAAQIVSAAKTTPVPVSLTLTRKAGSLVVTQTLDVAVATR